MSILSDIQDEIKLRLETVTVANGYQQNVGTVFLPTKTGNADKYNDNYNVTIRLEGLTKNEELSCAGNPPRIAWDALFRISGLVNLSDTSTSNIDAILAEFGMDLQTSIAANDPNDWFNFDSNSINAEIGGLEFEPETEPASVQFELSVTYRVSENDQTSLQN